MTKNELLAFLESAQRMEEANEIYAGHIKNTLYLSALEKELLSKIKEGLDSFAQESREHLVFVDKLIDEVKGGAQDVY